MKNTLLLVSYLIYSGIMPRVHQHNVGCRAYGNYSDSVLAEAISKIKSKELTMRAASRKYKIPFGTLQNKVHEKHLKPVGEQTVLSMEEEAAIIKSVTTYADWGYPFTLFDLRLFTKSYLDNIGRTVPAVKSNVPGIDWAYSLLKRNKSDIGQR